MWRTVKLDELFDFKNGRGFKKTEWRESGLPIIRIQNLNNVNAGFNYYEGDYDAAIEVNNGDLLFSWSGTVGTSFGAHIWEREKGVLNQHIFKLTKKKDIDTRYAFYCLKNITRLIEQSVVGAVGIRHVTKKNLIAFEIPLPPLAEQQRIVAKLDAAFTEIDRAILASSDSTNQLRSLSSNSAKEIFITLRNSEKVSPINDVCEAIFAGGDAPKDSLSDVRQGKYQIPIFANAMKDKGLYGYTENPRVKKPSVTVAGRGSGTGYTEIRREPFLPIVRLIVLTPKDDEVTVEFLKHAIVNLEVLSSGSAIPQLTVPMMKSYEIPVPPLDHQRVLTEKLDTLQRIADECLGVYERKVESLKALKSAILAQELQPPQSEAA